MVVFVTGATGTLGQPVVQRLIEAGVQVRTLSRSAQNDTRLRSLGAEPVRADLYSVPSLTVALRGADAVLHLASKIPKTARIGRRAAWRETDSIRREGTRSLVAAALSRGVKAFVYPSIVFLYPDRGEAWLDAATLPEPNEYLATTLDAEAEVARFAASGGRGVSLRMGAFYGPSSSQSLEMLRVARLGLSPAFGRDDAYGPLIWIPDAAQAVVAALSAPSGVYDIVDDEPLIKAELRRVIAQAVGRTRLWSLPTPLTTLMLGVTTDALTRSQRVSNARFKAVTDWTPEVPSGREGWAQLGALGRTT